MFFVKGNCRITASLKSREKGESGIEIFQIKTLNLLEICFPGFLPQSSYGLRESASQWHVCQWWALVGKKKKRLVIMTKIKQDFNRAETQKRPRKSKWSQTTGRTELSGSYWCVYRNVVKRLKRRRQLEIPDNTWAHLSFLSLTV